VLPQGPDGRFAQLAAGERFRFACHPGVPCFNQCCRKLVLWLTPYDVLRLRQRLGMGSDEFLERYTSTEPGQNGWPMPRLAMKAGGEETCPFLTPEGCSVYEDRPGACRTYPLGRATRGGRAGGPSEEGFFLVKEDHCQGFAEGPEWTAQSWSQDQGLETYTYLNDLFMPLITRQAPDASSEVIAQKMRMFHLACYKLESFRRFVLQTRLASLFEIPAGRLEVLETNDLELLKFAFQWLGFALFGDPTLTLRPEAAAAAQAGMPGYGGPRA
jgi:hypothetical protein